jgi:hypothetical protein
MSIVLVHSPFGPGRLSQPSVAVVDKARRLPWSIALGLLSLSVCS